MEKRVRVSDILAGKSISCRACASKERMSRLSFTERSERALKASMAAKAKAVRQAESNDATTIKELRAIRSIMHGARRRCTNKNDMNYANYGGRGVKFLFPSAADAADWALNNLGPRPKGKSIDRIDNDGHYEPGNLRWATPQEQNRNKRAYKGKAYGRRMANLLQQRQDYTYEGLRKFVKLGWSDEQILNHRKGSHTC